MYTSNYSSSSPVRTSTFGLPSTNYSHQPSNRINYNSYQNIDEGNSSLRHVNTTYINPQASFSNQPQRTPTMTPTRKYPNQSLSSRSYANENDFYRSTNRSQSYNDLLNDQNQSINYNNNSSQRIEFYDEDLIVKSTDLSAATEQEMIELVRLAFRKYDLNNQRELAGFLKRSADRAFSSCWHCIVGRQFSSYVTHEMNGFIYLTKGPLSILLFKSGT